MKDLIAKLEAAPEGSRELDAEIAYHVVASHPGITMHEDSVPGADVFAFWEGGICHNCSRWGPFTQSLDAALTLARHQGEVWDTLYKAWGTAYGAIGDLPVDGKPVDLWPVIRAALITLLKARS